MQILLINDTESAARLDLILKKLRPYEYNIKAIFPSLEYATMVIERNPDKFDFIIMEENKEQLIKKISMLNQLTMKFPKIQVITTNFKYGRSDTPNLHTLKDLETVATFIIFHHEKIKQ